MEIFRVPADESRYLEWLRTNPTGFVINTNRGTSRPEDTRLHLTTCQTITNPDKVYTGGDYIKLCSTNRDELTAWGRTSLAGNLSACGHCDP